jgi:hypothetical protein
MSIDDYIHAQKGNLESIKNLQHFSALGSLVDQLYNQAAKLVPQNTSPRYGRSLLLCHRSFLSAITLIGQAQPEDAAPITRRAIEAARICLALKFNHRNLEKWLDFENRMKRWKTRGEGSKPPSFHPPRLDFPRNHEVLDELTTHLGMLSDSYVHFTPEFEESQDWRILPEAHFVSVYLNYFISDQRTIERELLILAKIHGYILGVIDECLDWAFRQNEQWRILMKSLIGKLHGLQTEFRIKYDVGSKIEL